MEDDGNEFVYGIAPVLAALKADRRSKHALYVLEESRRKESRLDAVEELARETNVDVIQVEKGLLNEAVNDRPHQGCILCASKLGFAVLEAWTPPVQGACYLALDEIVDPQNLGSLCRTARFLGASVIVSAKNSAPLSAAASKASAGAIEEAPVYAVPNLPRALEEAKAQGWRVLGAGVGENSVPVSDLDPSMPSVLVVGSEGEGLRTTVRRACDALVQVGSAPDNSGVDSLNVGVAGAILLHHLLGGAPK
jgi:21S rRNA (GM2251-2'-O)-methyltransferase